MGTSTRLNSDRWRKLQITIYLYHLHNVDGKDICFKLPNSWLQYFIHLSVNMNPSQGIYGSIAATLVNCCYNSTQPHSPQLLKSYTQSRKTERLTETNAVRMCVHCSIPPSFVKAVLSPILENLSPCQKTGSL